MNSTTTGLATVRSALGRDPAPLLKTWALANYTDDVGVVSDRTLTHPSWNFRDIYGNTFGSYDASGTVFTSLGYPLRVTALTDGRIATASVRSASAAYYRFSVAAHHEALLSFASGSSAPAAALQFVAVRTR